MTHHTTADALCRRIADFTEAISADEARYCVGVCLRCPLLAAYDTPEGILVHQNGYKLSPEINAAESNESGRRANTRDGVNHWRDRSYFIGSSALADPSLEGHSVYIPAMDGKPATTSHWSAAVPLSCDHWRGVLGARRFWSDWKARTGRSTIVILKP